MKHISSMVVLGGLALAGCIEVPMLPLPQAGTAVLAVSDGTHDGNAHFFFLPPLVSSPSASASASGTFDASLEPEVEICIWDGSACGAVVATFNSQAGHGSETLRVDPEGGQYIVNWHVQDLLDDWPLDAGEGYRIRVLVGAQVLGWADVWIAPDARTRRMSEDLLLVEGQTLPIKFRIEGGAQTDEGATGIGAAMGAGLFHSCAVDAAGAAWCWGKNDYGQLGTGSTSPSYATTPQRVAGTQAFRAVYAGQYHTCGLTTDGAAYCWGHNYFGQLGSSVTSNAEATPVAVSGGHTFTSLAPGGYFTCGLGTDGFIYCWGTGSQGQLGGDSHPYTQSTPSPVVGGSSYLAVTAGQYHTCGIDADGSAHCWGDNTHGQLGTGPGTTGSPTPQLVALGLPFDQLEAGYLSSCGVTTSGAGYCWGYNAYGQVGDGSPGATFPSAQPSPTAVAGGHLFAAINAGGLHACGVTTAGAAYCWGFNGYGQVGDGTNVDRRSPVAVAGGLSFSVLSAGGYHTCGVTSASDAVCWGNNQYGALGNGTTSGAMAPGAVLGLDLTP